MACNLSSKRLAAIYQVVTALYKDGSVKNISELKQWFSENRPEIKDHEIVDSILSTEDKALNEYIKDLETELNASERLNDYLKDLNKIVKKPDIDNQGEVIKLTKAIAKIITSDPNLDGDVLTNGLISTMNVKDLYERLIKAKGDEAISAAKQVLERELGNLSKFIKSSDKLREYRDKINKIKEGFIPEDIPLNTHRYQDKSSELVRLESELGDLKSIYLKYKKERAIEEIAKKEGFFGYKGDTAIKIKEFTLGKEYEFWETFRAMKFMLDISYAMVNLAPRVVSDLMTVREGGKWFPNYKKLGNYFREGTIDVFMDDVRAGTLSSKRATGSLAPKLLLRIKSDPLYSMSQRAGLKISESRSVINAEEYFHSTVLNRIKLLGLAKDISDDIMTSTINTVRFDMFKEFVNSHPGISEEETAKVAEFINNFTGTTNTNALGKANLLFSAPRLAFSRLALAFQHTTALARRLDVNKTLKDKKITYLTEADQYIAKEMTKMITGYAKLFGMTAALGAIFKNIDFGEDDEDSDFLKVRGNTTSYDYTGGMGSMYRMLADALHLTFGVDKDANYLDKQRLGMREREGDKATDIIFETLFKNKLHPAITGTMGVISGKDFFGNPLAQGEGSSRLIAAGEALLPISVSTVVESISDKLSDNPTQTGIESTVTGLLQIIGVNAFEGENKGQSVSSRRFFNKHEFKPTPEYPKTLAMSGNEKDNRLLWLRHEYKNMHGDMIGELIESNPDMSLSTFKSQVSAKENAVQREFMKKYSDDIKKLNKVKKGK